MAVVFDKTCIIVGATVSAPLPDKLYVLSATAIYIYRDVYNSPCSQNKALKWRFNMWNSYSYFVVPAQFGLIILLLHNYVTFSNYKMAVSLKGLI